VLFVGGEAANKQHSNNIFRIDTKDLKSPLSFLISGFFFRLTFVFWIGFWG